MNIFKNLFGKKEGGPKESSGKSYKEKDDMGTRHDTLSKASSYWMARMSQVKKEPYVLYIFDKETDAIEALLELPCIHMAEDSNNMICTEVLIYGWYPTEDGKFEAIICGDDLTHELWQQAGESFTKHGGKRKNDLEPEKRNIAATKEKKAEPVKVKFVREDRIERFGQIMTYSIHSAPDVASAKAFLENKPVSKNYYYIVVETPEGNYCRDIGGIYKE